MANSSQNVTKELLLFTAVTSGTAAFTCLAALIFVFALKLHTKLVYRMAAYQVLTSLVFAISNTLNLAAVDYRAGGYTLAGEHVTNDVCQFVAFIRMYAAWLKLLAVVLVTSHLYCYVVRYKNYKWCELAYVVASVVVPTVISVIPFFTRSYGIDGQWCWIKHAYRYAEEEKLVLWFGPALFFLSIVSVAVVYMAVVQFRRTHLESDDETILINKQSQKQILSQLLPLLAYPVLFLIFLLPSLVSQMYRQQSGDVRPWLDPVNAFFSAALSFSAGLTLLAHVFVLQCFVKRRRRYM